MKNMTPANIAAWCNGKFTGSEDIKDVCVTAVTTDSRRVEPGCLFIPIKGARVDAHDFIPQVIENGALVTLTEEAEYAEKYPCILVDSTTEAIKDIAREYLAGLGTKVVSITGSVGKTSTKEIIYSVLSQKFKTKKTLGNFNNALGLPLTIFTLNEDDEIAVLEMGINHFGEMHVLASIAPPDVSVITNIGECHLEFLGDRDGVLRAKTEVFDHVKDGGFAVLNGDDDKLSTVNEVCGRKPVFYHIGNCVPDTIKGVQSGADVICGGMPQAGKPESSFSSDEMVSNSDIYADEIENEGMEAVICRIHIGNESIKVRIPKPGIHMVRNALAAAAVGNIFGMTPDEIKKGIESLEGISGRFNVIEHEGIKIIDDCYNANPMSMKASLGILSGASGRKVALLGDMGELGADSVTYHKEVGTYAARLGIDVLVTAGEKARDLAEAAKEAIACENAKTAEKPGYPLEEIMSSGKNGRAGEGSDGGKTADERNSNVSSLEIIEFAATDDLIEDLPHIIKKGDTVLVKASHSMEFDRVVGALGMLVPAQ